MRSHLSLLASLLLGAVPVHSQATGSVPGGYEIVPGTLRFSNDARRVAYVVAKDDEMFAVVDHELQDGRGHLLIEAPRFDPLDEHVYFRAGELNRKDEPHWRLLRDGKEIDDGGWIGPLVFAPDGTPAYWVYEDARGRGACVLHFGKKKSSKWIAGDGEDPPRLLEDGTTVASIALRGNHAAIITLSPKGKKWSREIPGVCGIDVIPGSEEVLTTRIKNFDRPRHVPPNYYLVRYSLSEKENLVHFGREYDSAGSPVFSPDGRRMVFKACGDGWMDVVDPEEAAVTTSRWRFVDDPVFSPDGSRLAYAACIEGEVKTPGSFLSSGSWRAVLPGATASSGRWTVVIDGEPGSVYEKIRLLRWSPDGERLAFTALHEGRWYVVDGDRGSGLVDEIADLRWSDESGGFVYGGLDGREIVWREVRAD